jgi:hypothetical protein
MFAANKNITLVQEEDMLKKLLVLSLVCAFTSSVWAADVQWFGGAHDRDWFNTANWGSAGGPIPTSADKAKLNYVWANAGPIVSAPGAAANEIFISEDQDPTTVGEQSLTIANGGALTTAGQIILGYNGADPRGGLAANEGRLVVEGGVLNVGTHLFVGFSGIGHLQMEGGTLNVTNMFGLGWNGGQATVELNGGTLHTEQWNFTNNANTSYSFDITEGKWVQNHFWVDEIQALVDDGMITAYGGAGTINIAWDAVNEQTIVTATIPEPITMTLIGLGALLIRKRS